MSADQTVINDLALFDTWCKRLADDILKSHMMEIHDMTSVIKMSILDNKAVFIECLLDRLTADMVRLKREAAKYMATNKCKYTKMGYRIATLKEEIKALNIAKRKSRSSTSSHNKMKKFLKENYPDIHNEYLKTLQAK